MRVREWMNYPHLQGVIYFPRRHGYPWIFNAKVRVLGLLLEPDLMETLAADTAAEVGMKLWDDTR